MSDQPTQPDSPPDPQPPECPPDRAFAGKSGQRGGGKKVSPRDHVAVLLAAGSTAVDAAAKVGIHERTVRRWLDEPVFRSDVERLRAEMVTAALGRLSATMATAAEELGDLIKSPDPHVRYKAARAVIELAAKLRETVELERRVEELERRLGEESPQA